MAQPRIVRFVRLSQQLDRLPRIAGLQRDAALDDLAVGLLFGGKL